LGDERPVGGGGFVGGGRDPGGRAAWPDSEGEDVAAQVG